MAKFTFQEAYNILKHDYNFFLEKDLTSDGNPTGDYDLDNLIIFTACRELLRRYKSKIKTTNDSTRVREIIKSNILLLVL